MPPKEGQVWSTARKVTGNLLPLVLASPFLVFAIRTFGDKGPSVALIWWIVAFLAASWVFLALLGYAGNGAMRKELGRRMHIERAFDRSKKWFVGFARPSFRSALDPHEDVGFLVLHSDRIEFWGAEHRVVLERGDIAGIRFRPNTHTLVGLGRWISIEGVVVDKPVRLLIEPREKPTLIANFFFAKSLLRTIRAWKEEGPPAEAGGPSLGRSTES